MDKNLKILIATGLYPPEMGGPATYSVLLERELPKIGIDVQVIAFSSVRKYPKVIRHFIYFWKILKASRESGLIYALDPVSVGLPALLASFYSGKKFFLRVAGDYAWEQGTQRYGVQDSLDDFYKNKYGIFVQLLKWVESAVALSADKIIVPSQYLEKVVVEWGVDAEKIKVIYNAFDIPKFDLSKEEARKNLKLEGKIILSIGRLVPWKGFDTLIEVFAEYKKVNPQSQLHIIGGDGPDKERLEAIVNRLNLKDSVHFLGKFSREELFKHIRAADLFVLGTNYEGFSHQILEVMALGVPIVTTAVGGNLEIIKNGESGILVPYNDKAQLLSAISTIMTDKNLIEKYTQNAKDFVANFSVGRMITEIAQVL